LADRNETLLDNMKNFARGGQPRVFLSRCAIRVGKSAIRVRYLDFTIIDRYNHLRTAKAEIFLYEVS